MGRATGDARERRRAQVQRKARSRRLFRHGELHLVLLALLAERPMHGYELMGELGDRFSGYRASAGSVYPALEALGAEGLIDEEAGSDPTAYRLTSTGEAALNDRLARLARLEERTGVSLGAVAPVERSLGTLTTAARAAARAGDGDGVVRMLDDLTQRLEDRRERKST